MRASAFALGALLTLSACASFDTITRHFEHYWSSDRSPRELARIGVRSSTFRGGWTIIGLTDASSMGVRSVIARRTEERWGQDIVTYVASSEHCPALIGLADELPHLHFPTLHNAWTRSETESSVVFESHSAWVRLEIGGLYTDDHGSVRPASVTLSAYGDTPLLEWYDRARAQLEQCWRPTS